MRRLLGALLTPTLLLSLAACGHFDKTAASASPAHPVGVSVSRCGAGWTHDTAGPVRIDLHNTDSRPGDVQVFSPTTQRVYAEVEPLGPGTTRTVRLDLAAGQYAVRCLMEDEAAVVGPTVIVEPGTTGVTDPAPGVVPAGQGQLVRPTLAYQAYVRDALPGVLRHARALSAAVAAGDRSGAESAWVSAHLAYERLGAAYDAFGDLDGAVNGRPDGLAKGVRDPGLDRLPPDRARALARRVDVGPARAHDPAHRGPDGVAAAVPRHPDRPADADRPGPRDHRERPAVRPHRQDDYGSGSELATARANLAGTDVVLGS